MFCSLISHKRKSFKWGSKLCKNFGRNWYPQKHIYKLAQQWFNTSIIGWDCDEILCFREVILISKKKQTSYQFDFVLKIFLYTCRRIPFNTCYNVFEVSDAISLLSIAATYYTRRHIQNISQRAAQRTGSLSFLKKARLNLQGYYHGWNIAVIFGSEPGKTHL